MKLRNLLMLVLVIPLGANTATAQSPANPLCDASIDAPFCEMLDDLEAVQAILQQLMDDPCQAVAQAGCTEAIDPCQMVPQTGCGGGPTDPCSLTDMLIDLCNGNPLPGGPPPTPCTILATLNNDVYELVCGTPTPCDLPGYSMMQQCGGPIGGGSFPPPGGNPCTNVPVQLPPCAPLAPLGCGSPSQCVTSLLQCTGPNPPAYCSILCALPGVPVINTANPIQTAPGGIHVNTVVVTASPCTGIQQTPGNPVFIPIQPDCVQAQTTAVPSNPTLQDRDGDGIPATYYDEVYYDLDQSCQLQQVLVGQGMIPFPDPDDANAAATCGPAEGTTYDTPQGYQIQDRDGDGWESLYVQMGSYRLDKHCNIAQTGNYEVPLNFPDPDDANPNVPPNDPIGVCGGAPGPCPVIAQPVTVLCGVEDADSDRVAIAYICEADMECYSNGACIINQKDTSGGYGDPDDNDPCVPLSDSRLNAQCRYGGRRFDDQLSQNDGNAFGADRAQRIWQAFMESNVSWLWLVILLGVMLVYVKMRKDQERRKGGGRR